MNEQLFKDLFDRAVDGIVLFDKDGGFIDANLSFAKALRSARMNCPICRSAILPTAKTKSI